MDFKSYGRFKKKKQTKKTHVGWTKLKQQPSQLLTKWLGDHVRLNNKHMLSLFLTIFL